MLIFLAVDMSVRIVRKCIEKHSYAVLLGKVDQNGNF